MIKCSFETGQLSVMARHLLLFLTLVFWKTSNADPHSKEVIRAMDKIISKHISWNDWDEWNALMQKVSKIQAQIFKDTYLYQLKHY